MLTTRCPTCSTIFRVRPEQLTARNGRVRCGKCQTAFSALASLEEMPDDPQILLESEASTTREPEMDVQTSSPALAPVDTPDAHFEHEEVAEREQLSIDETVVPSSEPVHVEPPAEGNTPFEPSPTFADAPPPSPPAYVEPLEQDRFTATPPADIFVEERVPPLVQTPPTRSGRNNRWLIILIAVLALAAIFTGAYSFRVGLARDYPGMRSSLEGMCSILGCTVPYPRDANSISVEGTDLVPDGSTPGQYHLTVTLRNRADYSQEWPQLELTLTDRFDRALSRRVIPPNEWLPKNLNAQPAFDAGAEVTSSIPVTTDLPAAGYRVFVFYP